MVNKEASHPTRDLDLVFAALSDSTRRSVLAQLAQPGADAGFSVSELAQPHGMSLPGFMKHLAVLEAAGLIARAKEGRVVRCALDAEPLHAAATWIAGYERFWTHRLDALGRFLDSQEEPTPCPPPPPPRRTPPASASPATTAPRPTRSGARGPTRKR